jgi:RsiW-degrading membrane proteinase PrsW (M82 family)
VRRCFTGIAPATVTLPVVYPAPSPVPPPYPYVAPMPRRIRKVGAPLGVIIGLGVLIGCILLLSTVARPVGTTLGFVLSSITTVLVLLAYLWLDRWEPEPPRLLIFAFVWGASISVAISLLLETASMPLLGKDGFAAMALGAPVIEEAAKGMFLLLMLTGRRRNELNSLTDCLVYAGFVAAGFAWLENIFYIGIGDSIAKSLLTAGFRLILGPFAHPLFTSMTAIGVYLALQQRGAVAKVLLILLGYCGAVVMHSLWNGSATVGAGMYLLIYVCWMVPIFTLAIGIAVYSRRREQRVVAGKLPGLVESRLITPNEATWLGSLRTQMGGKAAGKSVKEFAVQVVELAFVRERIDRGLADQRTYQLHAEEAYWLTATRAAAPVLQWLSNYRAY